MQNKPMFSFQNVACIKLLSVSFHKIFLKNYQLLSWPIKYRMDGHPNPIHALLLEVYFKFANSILNPAAVINVEEWFAHYRISCV